MMIKFQISDDQGGLRVQGSSPLTPERLETLLAVLFYETAKETLAGMVADITKNNLAGRKLH